MDTTIFLIRHGEVEYKHNDKGEKMVYGPDAHLSKYGIRQIERLSEKLFKEPNQVTILYSSPYIRAQETANILNKKLKTQIINEDRLSDVYTPGQENITMAELEKKIFTHKISGNSLGERMFQVITQILNKEKGKVIGIVSHGDPIRAYMDKLLFPDKQELSVARDKDYLGKGEAWRLVLDENLRLLERNLVQGEGELGQPLERKIY